MMTLSGEYSSNNIFAILNSGVIFYVSIDSIYQATLFLYTVIKQKVATAYLAKACLEYYPLLCLAGKPTYSYSPDVDEMFLVMTIVDT
jgi:hypothetical protein